MNTVKKTDIGKVLKKIVDKTAIYSKEVPKFVKNVNTEFKKTLIYQEMKEIDLKKFKSFLYKKW